MEINDNGFTPSLFTSGTRYLWLGTVLASAMLVALFVYGDYALRRDTIMGGVAAPHGSRLPRLNYGTTAAQRALRCPHVDGEADGAHVWLEAVDVEPPHGGGGGNDTTAVYSTLDSRPLGAFWPQFLALTAELGVLLLDEALAHCLHCDADADGDTADCAGVRHADFAVSDRRWPCIEHSAWRHRLISLSGPQSVNVTSTANHVYVTFREMSSGPVYSALLIRMRQDKDHYFSEASTESDLGVDAFARAWVRVPLVMHNVTLSGLAQSDGAGSATLIFYTPKDVEQFKWLYARSRLLHCRTDLAEKLRREYPQNYVKKALPEEMITRAAVFRDFLYSHRVSSYLFGGTLLGWYRECGLIPYTTDVDLAAWASEYDNALERDLIGEDKEFSLYWILGLPSDSLELSVMTRSHKIDLFFLFDDAEHNSTWVGGMHVPKREKLKWVYPSMSATCSGQLLGHLFMVPCNVQQFLVADYGADWATPHHDNTFVWYKSHHNIEHNGKWSYAQWPNVYRTTFPKAP